MKPKAPDYCRHPERQNCRNCPDSQQPRLFDGLCKWLANAWDHSAKLQDRHSGQQLRRES